MADALLVAAARHERDRRAKDYPQRIFDGKIDARSACIDYQCWVAITEWLETDRFFSFVGGDDPDREDAPIIRWPDLEAAAKKAVNALELKLAREAWLDGMPETETSRRRGALVRIHRKLELRRESIDTINTELRKRRTREVA